MFFIFGINQKEEQLAFDQVVVCDNCGRYGHMTVWVTYSYLMLFFIPFLKWGRRYFVRMGCCGAFCEISKEMGEKIAAGEITSLSSDDLPFKTLAEERHRCPFCGYTTEEDFQFCPKCGTKMVYRGSETEEENKEKETQDGQ